MTIEEKREALDEHCMTCACHECPIFKWAPAEYKSCDFVAGEDDMDHWPDDMIEEAHDLVFGQQSDVNRPTTPTTSAVEHPKHYNREGARECIYEMVLIFGIEETMSFCKLNAWKYRYRAADKNGEEDLKKSDWYIRMYEKLKDGEVL